MGITRRDFLKFSSLATAGLAGATTIKTVMGMEEDRPKATQQVKYVPSFCENCFWACGLFAKVVNGKVVKLEGNPLCPRSRGRLCARGYAGLGILYDPDRLKSPMINTGKRGDPKWQKASWDTALSYIAEKMLQIKEKYGPEAIALYSHGAGGSWWKHLLAAFGSQNVFAPSYANCRGARDTGFYLTFGSDVGSPEYYDFSESKFIVLFGHHLGENAHNSQVQDLILGLSRGARLVVVDPRCSNIASKANWWLPIKPMTDLALILAWIKILLDEELYDKEYIGKYATGLKELKEAVKDYTPEWAFAETGIPTDLIITIAKEMVKYKPAVCVSAGRFSVWTGDDTQRFRAIAILNALLGSWGRRGGYYLPAQGKLAKYPGLPEYPQAKPPIKGYPMALLPPTTALVKATITGEPYPVKGWFVYSCNIMRSVPNKHNTIEALRKLDLVVAIDILPTEVVNWADVVLPECTYLERYEDLRVDTLKTFSVAIRVPAVEPLFDSKPSWWITKELAKKIGLEAYFPWKDAEEYLKKRCEVSGLSYEELLTKGVIHLPETYNPYFGEDHPPSFGTPSEKIELYSKQLAEAGFDPVPKYTKFEEPPKGYFRLLSGRHPLHSFTRTRNNFLTFELYPENELWINAKKAKELNLREGDYVYLVNMEGLKSSYRIKVKPTERIRDDCVYFVHGFGITSKELTRAFGKGIADDDLISKVNIDPLMGGTGMRGNFVKIVKEGA